MTSLRMALLGFVVLAAVSAPGVAAQDKDEKKTEEKKAKKDEMRAKLIGTWEVTEGKGMPAGTKMTLKKDGSATFLGKRGDEELKLEGKFAVEGKSLKLTMKREDKEVTRTVKITKVSDKLLELEGPQGDPLTFKKVTGK